jgi:SH3-like domain-containing protein
MSANAVRAFTIAALALTGWSAAAAPSLAQVVEGEEHCVVNIPASDSLNVRSGAGVFFPIEGARPYGSCGIVVTGACLGNWCPVEDGHIAGWTNARFLSMVSPSLYCVANVANGDTLNLRAYPSSQSRVLTQLGPHQCDIAFLPYAVGSWQKIRVGGWEGWASRKYLSGE